jgi:uncharacterized protein (DUF362 family)
MPVPGKGREMKQTCNRRDFIVRTAALGATVSLGGTVHPLTRAFAGDPLPDIAVVEGSNYYDTARKAVETIGGMKKFVSKGSRVGLLVNSRFDKPGTYVKPQIVLAVIAMCHEAGAKEIVSLEGVPGSYWRKATLSKADWEHVDAMKSPGDHTAIDLPRSVHLKQIDIVRDFLDCDVLINVPIFKDHAGTGFTGVLKNIMGATSQSTNNFFHAGSGRGDGYEDVPFLSQCIADAHLVRMPTLCVGDGTEVISTNGPFGPGNLIRPRKVVAGTDGVAVDTIGTTLLGLHAENIAMIGMARDHGRGSSRLETLNIARISL